MWSFIEGVDFLLLNRELLLTCQKWSWCIAYWDRLEDTKEHKNTKVREHKSAVYRDLGVNEKPSDITSQTGMKCIGS